MWNKQQLIRHEGLRLRPYVCPVGKWTVGVGRNLESIGITKTEALFMLQNDINRATEEVLDILRAHSIQVETLCPARLDALTNLCFNIGKTRLLEFKKMLAAIKAGDWTLAAAELLDSNYATQVGHRALDLARQLDEGDFI